MKIIGASEKVIQKREAPSKSLLLKEAFKWAGYGWNKPIFENNESQYIMALQQQAGEGILKSRV